MRARLICAVSIAMLLIGIGCEPRSQKASTSSDGKAADAATREGERGNGDQEPNGTRYRINPEKSRLTAQVGVGGLLKGLGHPHVIAIRKFEGEVQTSSGMVGSASIRLKFATDSVAEVGKEFSEKDRQKVGQEVREKALESSKYPEARFKSRSVTVKPAGEHRYEASIRGDLSLHGVTHEVSFPAKVQVQGSSLHASGGFTILHSAYGIKRLSAGGGTVKAKDEINLSFDIQADQD